MVNRNLTFIGKIGVGAGVIIMALSIFGFANAPIKDWPGLIFLALMGFGFVSGSFYFARKEGEESESDGNQKTPQLKKKLKAQDLIGPIIIVIIMGVGAFWYHGGFGPIRPDIKVSAERLYSDYKRNELKADMKYKDRLLLVTGNVVTSFSQFGKPNILLGTESFIFSVQCVFEDNSRRLANLGEGERVKIKGKCTGKTGNIFLKDCSLH
jgi:hypothetical protein